MVTLLQRPICHLLSCIIHWGKLYPMEHSGRLLCLGRLGKINKELSSHYAAWLETRTSTPKTKQNSCLFKFQSYVSSRVLIIIGHQRQITVESRDMLTLMHCLFCKLLQGMGDMPICLFVCFAVTWHADANAGFVLYSCTGNGSNAYVLIMCVCLFTPRVDRWCTKSETLSGRVKGFVFMARRKSLSYTCVMTGR